MAIKRIDKDTQISIVNGRHGGFFYKSQTGDLIIDMADFGDEDSVTFGQLKQMLSRSRKTLIDLSIIVVSVEDDEVTIEDVVTSLKLNDSYNELLSLMNEKLSEINFIDVEEVDEFVRNATPEELGSILGSEKSRVKYIIAEAATESYKHGGLTDYNKMKIVAEDLGHKNIQAFWQDIESSNN